MISKVLVCSICCVHASTKAIAPSAFLTNRLCCRIVFVAAPHSMRLDVCQSVRPVWTPAQPMRSRPTDRPCGLIWAVVCSVPSASRSVPRTRSVLPKTIAWPRAHAMPSRLRVRRYSWRTRSTRTRDVCSVAHSSCGKSALAAAMPVRPMSMCSIRWCSISDALAFSLSPLLDTRMDC